MKTTYSKFKIKNLTLLLLLTFHILLLTSCDTTDPPSNKKVTLEFEDASCTEAWIKLKLNNIILPTEIELKQNDSTIIVTNININDTTLYLENLLPNKTYSFHATIKSSNHTSNKVAATTMDTTSHNFTWTEHYFGEYGDQILDVVVLDNNDIWAVGEIFLSDENGEYDSEPYGLVKWDGKEWSIEKVPSASYNHEYTIHNQFHAILNFGKDNIYLVESASLLKWDGEKYSEKAFFLKELPFNGQVHFMWGATEDKIYLGSVNENSPLYYYYENGWTTLDYGENRGKITNISGFDTKKDDEYNIYISMNFKNRDFYGKLFKVDSDNNISEFPWREERRISGVWMKDEKKIYACGGGVHVWNGKIWKEIEEIPLKYTADIVGTDYNNIFVVGDFGLIAHFNGVSWKVLEVYTGASYGSISIKNNTIAIGGYSTINGLKGIIKVAKF